MGTVRRCGSENICAYNLVDVSAALAHVKDLTDDYLRKTYPDAVFVEVYDELKQAEVTDTEFLTADGFDESFLGLTFYEGVTVAVYDYEKSVDIIMEGLHDDEDPHTTAVEHLEFNTLGAWVGSQTPFFLEKEEVVDTDRA